MVILSEQNSRNEDSAQKPLPLKHFPSRKGRVWWDSNIGVLVAAWLILQNDVADVRYTPDNTEYRVEVTTVWRKMDAEVFGDR